MRSTTPFHRKIWSAGALISLLLATLLLSGCSEEPEQEVRSSEAPAESEDPFADAAAVRVIHLAPSLGALTPQLDRPGLEGAPATARLLQEEHSLMFTGYTPTFHAAASPSASLVMQDQTGDTVVESSLAVEPGKSYLALVLESSQIPGIELREITTQPRPDAEGNLPGLTGRAQVFVFHAAEDIDRANIALQAVGGGDTLVWGDLRFGDDSLGEPQSAAPGEYQFGLIDAGSEPIEGVLAPPSLTLEADTSVFVFLVSGTSEGAIPQVVFAVDGPALPWHREQL